MANDEATEAADEFVMIRVRRKTRDRLNGKRPKDKVLRYFTDDFINASLDHSDLVADALAHA